MSSLNCQDVQDTSLKIECNQAPAFPIPFPLISITQVCVRRPNDDLVVTLISCNRDACMLPDHNGRLPLHLACSHGASLKVMQTLLMEYPEAVQIKDNWGKTPLCNASACTSFDPKEKEAILDALDQQPTYWHVMYERMIWNEEEAARRATTEKKFQQERQRYAEKINRLLKDSKDERLEFFATKKIYDETINRLTQDIKNMKNMSYSPDNTPRSSDHNLEEHVHELEMELALLRLEVDCDGDTKNSQVRQNSASSLRLQLDDALNKNLALESEADKYADEAARLASEVEHLVASEAELKAYSEELFAELESFVAANTELEKSLENVQAERDQLKHELAIKTVELEMQTDHKMSSNPATPSQKRSAAASPDSQHGRSPPDFRAFNFNARVLEVKLKDEQEYNIQLKRELTKARSEVKHLEDQLQAAGVKNSDLENQVTELTNNLNLCREAISRLEEKESQCALTADTVEHRPSSSEEQYSQSINKGSSTELDILTAKLAGANTCNSTLRKELEEWKEKCKILERKLRSENCSLEKADDASLLMSSLSQSAQFANNRTRKIAHIFEEKLIKAMEASSQATYRHKQEKKMLHLKIEKLQETIRTLALQNQANEILFKD